MGTKMAPAYANIFMGTQESRILSETNPSPTHWKRYIDDMWNLNGSSPVQGHAIRAVIMNHQATKVELSLHSDIFPLFVSVSHRGFIALSSSLSASKPQKFRM